MYHDVTGEDIEVETIDRDASMEQALQPQNSDMADDLGREVEDRHAHGGERDEHDEDNEPGGAASDHERGLPITSIPR